MSKGVFVACLETLDTLNEKRSGKICNVLSVAFCTYITVPVLLVHVEQFYLGIIATISALTVFQVYTMYTD